MKRFRLRLIRPTDLEAVFILMSDISYAKSALNSRHSIANVVKIPHDLRDRHEKIRGDDLRAKVEIDLDATQPKQILDQCHACNKISFACKV